MKIAIRPEAAVSDVTSAAGRTLTIVSCVLAAVATISVGLRIVARKTQSPPQYIGADGYAVLGSLVSFYGIVAEVILMSTAGRIGFPNEGVSLEDRIYYHKLFFAFQITYPITSALINCSWLCLIWRQLGFSDTQMKKSLYLKIAVLVVGGLVAAWLISVLAVSITRCSPVQQAWVPTSSGICHEIQGYLLATAISGLILDASTMSMPVVVLMVVAVMKKSLSVVLMGTTLVLFAALYCSASLVKIVRLARVTQTDLAQTSAEPVIWTVVELGIGVIIANIAFWRQLRLSLDASRRPSAVPDKHEALWQTAAPPGTSGESVELQDRDVEPPQTGGEASIR